MAICSIVEYPGVGSVLSGSSPLAATNGAIEQPDVAIAAGSNQSVAFASTTKVVRVNVDSICRVTFGANPTAIGTQGARMVAGQTEYFGVKPGQKLAVISSL